MQVGFSAWHQDWNSPSETNFLFRAGTGYEFELMPRWSLAPEINADFVDGDTKLVYGLTLSWEFLNTDLL